MTRDSATAHAMTPVEVRERLVDASSSTSSARARARARRGAAARLDAPVELVPDRLPHPRRTRRRSRAPTTTTTTSSSEVPESAGLAEESDRGAQGREEGLLPVLDGPELPRRRRGAKRSRSPSAGATTRPPRSTGEDGERDPGLAAHARARRPSSCRSARRRRAGRRTTSRTRAASSCTSSSAPSRRTTSSGSIPPGTRSVSVFLVNQRASPTSDERDVAFAFQAELEVRCDASRSSPGRTCAAPAPRTGTSGRRPPVPRQPEYAVGHGVSADWDDRRRRVPRAPHRAGSRPPRSRRP